MAGRSPATTSPPSRETGEGALTACGSERHSNQYVNPPNTIDASHEKSTPPAAREIAATEGELQSFTPTVQALVTPDIDESLDEQPAKTRFWNAFKLLGTWWAELPPY